MIYITRYWGFLSGWLSGKESSCNVGAARDMGSISGLGKSPGDPHDNPTLVFLPGESLGQRSLVGYNLWGHRESDMTEATWHTHNQILPFTDMNLRLFRRQ